MNRFPNAIEALQDLKRTSPENSDLNSEAELAIQMILGKRPGIEEKYNKLILKLDRTYTQLENKRAYFEKISKESPLFKTKQHFKHRAKAITLVLEDLRWMRARNRDLISALRYPSTPTCNPASPVPSSPQTECGP
jgi:hypothetical protein